MADANTSWTRDSVSCGSDHPDGASGGRVALTLRRAAVGDRCSGAQSQPLRRPVHRPHRWPDLSRPPRRIDAGAIRSVALVEPTGALCPLPLNELALLTAARPRATKRSLEIGVTTPHPHPLHPFGEQTGSVVEDLLRRSDITLHPALAYTSSNHDMSTSNPAASTCIRIGYPLPTITGPHVRGIPDGAVDRFLAIDDGFRIRGTGGTAFAGGTPPMARSNSATSRHNRPLHHPPASRLAGAGPAPSPRRPVLRGTLLTRAAPVYFRAHLRRDQLEIGGAPEPALATPSARRRRGTGQLPRPEQVWAGVTGRLMRSDLGRRPKNRWVRRDTTIVIRTVGDQLSLWDAGPPARVAADAGELSRVDELLDDEDVLTGSPHADGARPARST